LQEFYQLRIDFYGKRKEYLRSKLKRDLQILDMKVKFVLELLEDKLVIKNVKRADLCARLEKGGYVKFSDLTKIQSTKLQEKVGTVKIDEKPEENAEEAVNDEREKVVIAKAKEYDYLLTMNMWTLTY
jgi:DNA topoisomerase-2